MPDEQTDGQPPIYDVFDPLVRGEVIELAARLVDALDATLAMQGPKAINHVRNQADQLMRATARILIALSELSKPDMVRENRN